MPTVLPRIHAATMTAFSLVCAYTLAFWWQLDKPFWAGFTVFMVSLPSLGQSLQKGLLRTFGTFLGAGIALVLLMTLHQDRMLLLLGLSLYLCLMLVLMHIDDNYAYFFYISAIVTLVIVLMSVQDPLNAFQLAVYRTEETLLGIGVYTVVTLLVAPKSSVNALYGHLAALRESHQRLHAGLQINPEKGMDRDALRTAYALYSALHEENDTARLLLPAVKLERYQVYRDRRYWVNALACSAALAEAQRDWAGTLAILSGMDESESSSGAKKSPSDSLLHTVFTDFSEKIQLLTSVFDSLNGKAPAVSLAGEKPEDFPTIEVNAPAFARLDPTERSGIQAAQTVFQRLLFLCQRLRGLTGYLLDDAPAPQLHEELPRPHPMFSPEQRHSAFAAFVFFWSSTFIWLVFDPPGTTSARFLEMTVLFGLSALFVSKTSLTELLSFLSPGVLFTGVMYVFVYPAVTSVEVFMLLLFGVAFGIVYLFPTKQQGIKKLGIMLPWLALCQFDNTPVYNFDAFINGGFAILLAGMVILLVHSLFLYSDAESEFIRAQRIFFRAITAMFLFLDKRHGQALTSWERLHFWLLQRHVTFTAEKLRYAAGNCPLFEPELARLLSAESLDIAAHVRGLSDALMPLPDFGPFATSPVSPLSTRIAAQSDVVRDIINQLLAALHQTTGSNSTRLSSDAIERTTSLCGSILKAISGYAAIVREIPWSAGAQRTL